jgi:hypothetical protein
LLSFRVFFSCDVPTLALQGIRNCSLGNYSLMDEESTGGIYLKNVYATGNYPLRDEDST